MTRALLAAVFVYLTIFARLVGAASAATAADVKPVATVKLGCESGSQQLSHSGELVAITCHDHSARLVDVASGRELRTFPGSPWVTDFSFSRDGRWLAIGTWDGTVEIVPTNGAGEPKRWKASSHRIHIVEFLGDSDSILVAGLDDPGQIWDVRGAPKVRATFASRFAGVTASAVSADGKLVAAAEGDTSIRVFDAASGKMQIEFTPLRLETFALAFAPDGKYLLAGGAEDHVSVIDLATGKQTRSLGGEAGAVIAIAVLGNGDAAAAWYFDPDTHGTHWAQWNLDAAKPAPLTADPNVSGWAMVRGKLWVTRATNDSLQIWEVR
jgi:WD40 repeat protein